MRRSGGGTAIPSDTLDSVSEPYTGDAFPQTGYAIEAPPPRFWNLPRDIDRSYKIEGGATVLGLVRFLAQIVPKCFT
ncbi:MAG: hypothetical protein M3Z96_05390 [Pseudomonadota bacterium]|nr:hypothetical protein [Pseudomonadota bacterium]